MDDRPLSMPYIAPEREAPRRDAPPLPLPSPGQDPTPHVAAPPAPSQPGAALPDVVSAMRLQSGYAIEALPGPVHEALQLRAPDGRVCLRIELTPQGPMVELTAVSLSVATTGSLRLDCEQLEINAREGMSLQSEGRIDLASRQGASLQSEGRIDLVSKQGASLQSEGRIDVTTQDDLRLEADGDLRGRARAQFLTATRGDVILDAAEDVMLDGQQIRMNSPRTPGEVQRMLERRAGSEDLLVRYLPAGGDHATQGPQGLPAAQAAARKEVDGGDSDTSDEPQNPEIYSRPHIPGARTPEGA